MRRHLVLALVLVAAWTLGTIPPVFSQPTNIAPRSMNVQEARLLAVAQDEVGTVWAAWEADIETDQEILYSFWADGTWSEPQPVQYRPGAWDHSPSLAIASDGTPWVAWSTVDKTEPNQASIFVSRWTGEQWSTPQAIPLNGISRATEPSLAAGPDGSLWLAWVGFDGTDDEIFASQWAGKEWSVPQQVSAKDDDNPRYDRQPAVAVSDNGRPWIVWTGNQGLGDDEIFASQWTGTGWTTEQMVSQDDDLADASPELALDAKGTPYVAWKGWMADTEQTGFRILLSHLDAESSSWAPERVASPAATQGIRQEHASLAFDATGQVHLAWLSSSASESALAHTRWEQNQESEPQMVQAAIVTHDLALIVTQTDVPKILWLDPRPGTEQPLHWAPVDQSVGSLTTWRAEQAEDGLVPDTVPFPNKYLAFGDSVTWGGYPIDNPHYPYPSILQDLLRARVISVAVVVNSGEPGEGIPTGADRIKHEVNDNRPQYVMAMEGTNDVSREHTPAEVYPDLLLMIDNARKNSDVEDVKVMLATIIPRLDGRNPQTEAMNLEAIIPAQQTKNHVRFCDPWTAFWNYGDWQSLMWDEKHPNQTGLQLLADTFYACIITGFGIPGETTPPTVWMNALPAQSGCGPVNVSWGGTDNLSWVTDYDVQVKVNDGPWNDWLVATPLTSAVYDYQQFGDRLSFQVRGRDAAGNQSDYSAPVYTDILLDSVPPEVHANSLPPIEFPPFTVSWWGTSTCAGIVAYEAQYSTSISGPWSQLMAPAMQTSAVFDPAIPQGGVTHYFQARAIDQANHWGPWSDPLEAYTTLAGYQVSGHTFNTRHEPITGAQVNFDPSALWTGGQGGGGFLAYLGDTGSYDVTVFHGGSYGLLPTMHNLQVNGDVSGLEFILPPQDDAVAGGDFETLNGWQTGGSQLPSLVSTPHTGGYAVQIGGSGANSELSQVISPGSALINPALSFMTRLSAAGPASTLEIELSNTGVFSPPVTYSLVVGSEGWTHAWYDLAALAGQQMAASPSSSAMILAEPLTLTFVVSDDPAILIDEVRLGSAPQGTYLIHLPIIADDQ